MCTALWEAELDVSFKLSQQHQTEYVLTDFSYLIYRKKKSARQLGATFCSAEAGHAVSTRELHAKPPMECNPSYIWDRITIQKRRGCDTTWHSLTVKLNRAGKQLITWSSESPHLLFNHLEGWSLNNEAERFVKVLWICPALTMQNSVLQYSSSNPLRDEAKVQQQHSTCRKGDHCSAHRQRLVPLCLSISWPQFKPDLMSSSHDECSYHTTQMSERMPAGSGLWWEFLVMRGGTRCAHWLPRGRQINYSASSFVSTRLRWQHMREINLCIIHERTSRCLKAMSWVRGAHKHVERQNTARNGGIANCNVSADSVFNRCRWWRKQHRNASWTFWCGSAHTVYLLVPDYSKSGMTTFESCLKNNNL